MLNYEMCKKLKESGYPQKEGDYFYYVQEYSSDWDYHIDGVVYTKEKIELIYVDCDHEEYGGKHEVLCYCPTLSELIDACGSEIHFIRNNIHTWEVIGHNGHFAMAPILEEAVANLWLNLHTNTNINILDDHLNG